MLERAEGGRLPAPLSYFPDALLRPQRSGRAILVAWLLSMVGSLALAAATRLLAPELATPQFPDWPPAILLFMLVVFAPVVETLIMATALELLLRLRATAGAAIVLSTAGWAIAHSMKAAAWGLAVWWPFLIFSTLYVVWRQRSFAAAIAVPLAAHMLQNLLPAVLIASGLAAEAP